MISKSGCRILTDVSGSKRNEKLFILLIFFLALIQFFPRNQPLFNKYDVYPLQVIFDLSFISYSTQIVMNNNCLLCLISGLLTTQNYLF